MNYGNKKVIFVTGGLTGGGAERVMAILASQAAELGAEVTLVILREKGRSYHLAERVNCIQIQSRSKLKMLDRIRQLHHILKNSDATTVIPFLPIISLYTMAANIGVKKRVILSERADPRASIFSKNQSMKDKIGNILTRKLGLYNLADWMVFQTPDAQSYYGKRLQARSSIIPNPLDTAALPERYDGKREKRIIAAGRLSEEKNFPMLLHGFAKFHEDYPEYRLILYGEGKQRGELEKLTRQLHLEDSVLMPGFVDNLSEKMREAAMYISTSNHEGISNSMLEALGMGVPTIVTDCPVGGAKMFVKPGENGELIPMNDVSALTEAMNRIASDEEYAHMLSCNAEKIRDELAAERICRKWLEIV